MSRTKQRYEICVSECSTMLMKEPICVRGLEAAKTQLKEQIKLHPDADCIFIRQYYWNRRDQITFRVMHQLSYHGKRAARLEETEATSPY